VFHYFIDGDSFILLCVFAHGCKDSVESSIIQELITSNVQFSDGIGEIGELMGQPWGIPAQINDRRRMSDSGLFSTKPPFLIQGLEDG
jgi:hypothetical protein